MNGSDGFLAASTAAVTRENTSWLLRGARGAAASGINMNMHPACQLQPPTENKTESSRSQGDAGDVHRYAHTNVHAPASVLQAADKGALLQDLSIALFSKLAESLPKDQGPLSFLSWEDGSWYCGHVREGTLDGLGVYRYTDNSVYCGQWARDRLHGLGVFITPSGFVYRGGFQADKQNGPGIFVVPQGPTFFGHFRDGRLHGFSCCVSPAGATRPLLGEWRDGEFFRALPVQARITEFYSRAAESLDLLHCPWAPVPVPLPDAFIFGLSKEETPQAHAPPRREHKLCAASMLEALRVELPKSLLQLAAAEGDCHPAHSQQAKLSSGRLSNCAKPIVRKRKASTLKAQGKEAAPANSRNKGFGGDGCGTNGGSSAPPRATTTKAQLLRWESEARKLPRIPHLNYNRVLGRWYARVRDPASGRRIWKGYTCAVHGFFQARDMAIDRLRQFSQLVSPLPSATPDEPVTTEEGQQTSEVAASPDQQLQQDQEQEESFGESQQPNEAADICDVSGTPLGEVRDPSEEAFTQDAAPPLAAPPAAVSAACSSLKLAACEVITPTTSETQGGEGNSVEENKMPANEKEGTLGIGLFTDKAIAPAVLEAACGANTGDTAEPLECVSKICQSAKDQSSVFQSSELACGAETSERSCLQQEKGFVQDEESVSCSRLTTQDCSDSALRSCTPTYYESA
ncbi:uncharacterized protein EMH_0005360 [Eimeria mitis]|uniref:AP2/ERF domain-containing protein n=1 Tax=Eimeria mitis TaxID=44415 RepID=U6KJF6_9EIME|nr:uncharacterized protein EMH_0005360 [Eimeria mitis]CDJ35593.1 hypothetical protein, conserved [Eimeria mitis]